MGMRRGCNREGRTLTVEEAIFGEGRGNDQLSDRRVMDEGVLVDGDFKRYCWHSLLKRIGLEETRKSWSIKEKDCRAVEARTTSRFYR